MASSNKKAASPLPRTVSAIIAQGFVWQKIAAFSFRPRGKTET